MIVIPFAADAFDFSKTLSLYGPLKQGIHSLKVDKYISNFREPLSIEDLPRKYLNNVRFWRDIYSYFDSSNILIHSKNDLSNVFEIINLTNLYSSEKNRIVAEIKKNRLMHNRLQKIKNDIINCYQTNYCKFQINKNRPVSEYLKGLRTQTGQLDILKQGIKRFNPYKKTFKHIINLTKSNPDWLAIPFLESSFNSKAISKVGATGAWQIMSYVGKRLMPINNYVDTRKNPVLSAYAGLKILRQNRIITKNEDISIISYNSGLRNYFNLKKKINKNKITTGEYLELSRRKNKSFSFASENFLLEYYAMKEFLKREKILGPTEHADTNSKDVFSPFISRCKTRPSKVISLLKKHNNNSKHFNNHFRKKYYNRVLPPGQIYLSSVDLPAKYYKKIIIKRIDDMPPLKWKASYNNCSII